MSEHMALSHPTSAPLSPWGLSDFITPEYTIPSTGNCGNTRGISDPASVDCHIVMLPLTASVKYV